MTRLALFIFTHSFATSKEGLEGEKNFSILFAVVLALSFSPIVAAPAVAATTIYVPDDYPTIQAAVDAAASGDTIIVRDGPYTENIDVSTDNLTIQSENGADVTIVQAANPDDFVFDVRANYVTISGFKVQGGSEWPGAGIYLLNSNYCNIVSNNFFENFRGVLLCLSHNNMLTQNEFLDNKGEVILLDRSSSNTITNNQIYKGSLGISISSSSNNNTISNNQISNNEIGMDIFCSTGNTLTGNTISENKYNLRVYGSELSHYIQNIDTSNKINGKSIQYLIDKTGIVIDSSWDVGYLGIVNCADMDVRDLVISDNCEGILLAYSTNTKVENVAFYNNSVGINLDHSSNITLIHNIVSNNHTGIQLKESSNNLIFLNDFIENTYNFNPLGSINYWQSPEKVTYTYNGNACTNYLGNYWSDYLGSDSDGDGIGDSPYSIDSDNDNYPLMEPFKNYGIGLTPRTWYVDDDLQDYPDADFTKIQDAVDAASTGDVIIVYPGTYTENVNVDKSLTIQSKSGAEVTIVQAANSDDHVFEITGDYVNIDGFTEKGTGADNKAGIYLDHVEHCTISNNTAVNNNDGIFLNCSNNNELKSNSTLGNACRGIFLGSSSNNTITNNDASSNGWDGIFLWLSSHNNDVTNNTASNNGYSGIVLYESPTGNAVTKNHISANKDNGIYLRDSSNNAIYQNDLTNNAKNAYFDNSANTWNSPTEIIYTYNGNACTNYLGNYWSDYSGSDTDGDGVGDIPYPIDSDDDNYPLTEPFENYDIDTTPPTVSGITPEDSATNVEINTVITAAFNEAMDNSTITTDSFTLSGSAVSGTITYDPAAYIATFTPSANLEYNHQYTATLSTAITDEAGNPLSEAYSWSFTTESAPNQPPEADFYYTPFLKTSVWERYPAVDEAVSFDVSLSKDTDGDIVSYIWDFGDGTTSSGMMITHTYSTVGDYTVNLTVIDNDGATDSITKTLKVVPEWRKEIRVGDILLDWTFLFGVGHAGMYIGNGWVIEARSAGVIYKMIETWDSKDANGNGRDSAYLVRVGCSDETAQAAVEFARCQFLKPYDHNWFAKQYQSESTSWYCSELVWAAYYNQQIGGKPIDIEDTPDEFGVSSLEIYLAAQKEINGSSIIGHHGTDWNYSFPAALSGVGIGDVGIGIFAFSPIDLTITDPDGLRVSKLLYEIPGSVYFTDDLNDDGSPEDAIWLPFLKSGDYTITVTPHSGALPTETYTLIAATGINTVLTRDVQIRNIPENGYIIQSTENGITAWDYLFEDSVRGTKLYLNTSEQTFQFIALDKEFPIKEASSMKIIDISKGKVARYNWFSRNWWIDTRGLDLDSRLQTHVAKCRFNERPEELIIIHHQDEELWLSAIAIAEGIDFCAAYAVDIETKNHYLLLDSRGVEPTGTTSEEPVASFTASKTEGRAPLFVQFTDKSTGEITSWQWDFGDSSTSTRQNPSHIYWRPGNYTVTLTVGGSGGSDTVVKNVYITVKRFH